MWRDSYATKKYMARGRIFFWEEFAWMLSFFARWHYMYGEFPVPRCMMFSGGWAVHPGGGARGRGLSGAIQLVPQGRHRLAGALPDDSPAAMRSAPP